MSQGIKQETSPSRSGGAPATAAVSVQGVSKKFGDLTAVNELSIDIRQGEFFSMLGPSGSGKTTVLRMIAGFEDVSAGKILLDGADVTRTAPFDREVNTVFQDYALFPHQSVAENVAYGLKVRKVDRSLRTKMVGEALEQVQLSHLADRRPSQLSGGQRQRIALARALILRPKVLLLDEPLGALDKQLREQMQFELKQIQRDAGITFVFVTHDQEEALTLSDRVAVFNGGRIEQVGSPREIYEFPQTVFVAKFLGVTNLLPAALSRDLLGVAAVHSLRPERVRLAAPGSAVDKDAVALPAVVLEEVYAGPHTRYLIEVEGGLRLTAETQNSHAPRVATGVGRGDAVSVQFLRDHATTVPETQDCSATAA
jgi:putative spermidine/putrescine transport system ATP-binding protein